MSEIQPHASGIDFASEELPNLHALLTEMREQGPVSPILFAGNQIWLINDYATVKKLIADDEILSAPAAYDILFTPTMGRGIPTMVGKQHRLNRAVVAKVFFPAKMRELAKTLFAEEASRLADGFEELERVDLVKAFTRTYTFNNIARLLGLPREDVDQLQDWADRIMHSFINLEDATTAGREMGEYLMPLILRRREAPEDDMLSLLTQAEVEGKRLDDEEMLGFCRNLFPAAIDTSTNSLGSLLAYTLEDRELWRALPGDRKLCEAAVEELLRWEPPLVMVPRRCVDDFELGGYALKAGDDVRMCITGANDDPKEFPNPRAFELGRPASGVTFGYGVHFCLGSQMARRVLETGARTLAERFPDMTLCDDEPVEIVGGVLRGPRALWVQPKGS